MKVITYYITLLEPLLATSLSGDPNSATSYPFIPGSMMRGVLASRIASPGSDLAKVSRDLLFNGHTRFLHAYPVDNQGRRRLPAPLSWRKQKDRQGEDGPIEDRALKSPGDETFDSPVDGFASVVDAAVSLRKPERQIAVHTLRERTAGRPTKGQGEVYRYDAIAPGEIFAGVILAEEGDLAMILQLLTPGECFLGGAVTAGYGRVRISHIAVPKYQPWQECAMPGDAIADGETFVITLLSDAILRGEDGATHANLPGMLQALGWPVASTHTFAKIVPVGGFNHTWGLPLSQTWAVRAGSVFVMEATAKITRDQVQSVLMNSLGERRVEGFGRLAIDWQAENKLTQVKAGNPGLPAAVGSAAAQPTAVEAALAGAAEALAGQMALRRRRRDLDQALLAAINASRIAEPPHNRQLSRVRVVARDALSHDELERIAELFKATREGADGNEQKNPHALKGDSLQQFESARLDGMPLSKWISDLAMQPGSVWSRLGGEHSVSLGGVEPTGLLAKEYAVRLIDGVLDKAMAERRRKGGD